MLYSEYFLINTYTRTQSIFSLLDNNRALNILDSLIYVPVYMNICLTKQSTFLNYHLCNAIDIHTCNHQENNIRYLYSNKLEMCIQYVKRYITLNVRLTTK